MLAKTIQELFNIINENLDNKKIEIEVDISINDKVGTLYFKNHKILSVSLVNKALSATHPFMPTNTKWSYVKKIVLQKN